MDEVLKLYHGSQMIIDSPGLDKAGLYADFGKGFYLTQSEEVAKEWACADETDGFANMYELNTKNLKVLDLTSRSYSLLNWLALVLINRQFPITSEQVRTARDYIIDHYTPLYERKDVIIGYRCDNAYFSFTNQFLASEISVEDYRRAMKLGEDGLEVVLRTKKAVESLEFISSIPAEKSIYYPKMLSRDSKVREDLQKKKGRGKVRDARYMFDIIGEEWEANDTRIRGKISK